MSYYCWLGDWYNRQIFIYAWRCVHVGIAIYVYMCCFFFNYRYISRNTKICICIHTDVYIHAFVYNNKVCGYGYVCRYMYIALYTNIEMNAYV